MMKNNDRCTCPHLQRISRRDFIKIAAVAGAGLLASCIPARTAEPTEEGQTDGYIAYCGTSYCLACPQYKGACAGCLAGQDEAVSTYATNCVVRVCNMERDLANCAYCEEYPCDKLDTLYTSFGGMADARAALEAIHQSLP